MSRAQGPAAPPARPPAPPLTVFSGMWILACSTRFSRGVRRISGTWNGTIFSSRLRGNRWYAKPDWQRPARPRRWITLARDTHTVSRQDTWGRGR